MNRIHSKLFRIALLVLLAALCTVSSCALAARKPKPTPIPAVFPAQATELDLSGQVLPSADQLIAGLRKVEGLQTIRFQGCNLSRDDMRALLSAFPGLTLDWTVKTNKRSISSLDTTIDFGKRQITDEADFIDALSCLPNAKVVHTYATTFRRANMALLKELYPDTEFGWTVQYANARRIRTDAEVLTMGNNSSTSRRFTEETFEVLKYCKNLKMLDLGHNMIRDISFLRELPQLKLLILVDNAITDLTPLEDLKELEYLELFKNPITDISPLQNMPKLLDLNLCFTRIKDNDVTPLLTNTTLQRCWISHAGLSEEQKDLLTKGLPNCQFDFIAGHSTADRWREHGRYFVYKKGFKEKRYIPFDGTEQPPPPLRRNK